MNNNAALSLVHIHRHYQQGDRRLEVLSDVNLNIARGEIVALVGPSGSGKTTLLQIAGLLDAPNSGEVYIAGVSCAAMSEAERTKTRLARIGFIYQFHHLLPEFSARENVMIPQMIQGVSKKQAGAQADDLLQLVGLTERATHRPAELSGGEQQRVAIVRAMANNPALILADEPTGNLDPATAESVFKAFVTLTREKRISLLIATHNMELAARMDRVVTMQNGTLVEKAK